MFVLAEVEDIFRIHPNQFTRPRFDAIKDEINKKYSYKVLYDVGFCLFCFDIQKSTDPIVHACQDGSYQQKVVFRLVVFRPMKSQILLGMIKECDPVKGVKLTMNYFDDIYIPPAYLMPNSTFNREENVWVWNYNGEAFYMDPGNWVRFRVEQTQFQDVGPIKESQDETLAGKQKIAPMTIYASAADSGLGIIDWWVSQ